MNLLSVENLAKSFGEFPLFTNLSFGIDKGDKCALVAQNGSGKTTLINILQGLDIQDKGNYAYRDGINISFLDQNPEIPLGFTIRDYIFTSKHQQILLVKEYDELLASGDLSGVRFENLMNEMKKVHQFLVFSVNSFSQNVISEYLDVVDFGEVSKMYQRKRDLFQGLIKNSRFELMPCDGTYFQVVNYNAISKENDVDFAKKLIIENGVAAIPISVFYEDATDKHMLRFCFAKTDETLIAASEKLCSI